MKTNRGHFFLTLLLAFAAVIFGMVLAGGSRLTPSGFSAPGPQRVSAPAAANVPLPSFADLAEAVLPAVVTVQVKSIQTGAQRRTPFEFFFGPQGQGGEEPEREFRSEGTGSGFVISSDGWIVTNNHVVEDATTVEVVLDDREYAAEVKGRDPATDLALLKVDIDRDLPYLGLAQTDELRVGDWVMAVGSPLLLSQSVTVGVVSAKGRSNLNITDSSFENFIQTDAAINRGNSGGPLVNLRGEVVGINTAMNFGAENVGFAVPVSTLNGVLDQLQSTGHVRRGYLGVNITNLDHDSAEAFGVDSTDGALVQEVVANSPAQEAGLRNGDIITRVDGQSIRNTRQLIDYIAAKPPDSKVQVDVLRGGRSQERTITLGEREGATVAEADSEPEESEMEWLGLQYQDLTSDLRRQTGIPRSISGVFISDVAASSPLIDEAVRPGNVIVEVNGEDVGNLDEFEELVETVEPGGFLRLYVRRFRGGGSEQGFFAIVRVPVRE